MKEKVFIISVKTQGDSCGECGHNLDLWTYEVNGNSDHVYWCDCEGDIEDLFFEGADLHWKIDDSKFIGK